MDLFETLAKATKPCKLITIKKDKSMIELSILLGRSPDLLIDQIMGNAFKAGYVIDDMCVAGKLLIDQIKDGDLITNSGACLFHTGSYDKDATKLFCKLILWGIGDCPECGGFSESSPANKFISSSDNLTPPEIKGKELFICMNCEHEFYID